MLKKTIKYTDFMEQERSEDFFFHLTETDYNRWMAKYAKHGGVVGYLKDLAATKDIKAMSDFIDELITVSYGVPAQNGRNFLKNDQVIEDFKSCAAYDELFTELLTVEGAAQKFLSGIMPKKLISQAREALAKDPSLYAELAKQGADRATVDSMLG